MQVDPQATVAELLARFPDGFSVGCSGELSRILAASSHLSKLVQAYPMVEGNQGYLVVDMDPAPPVSSPDPGFDALHPVNGVAGVVP